MRTHSASFHIPAPPEQVWRVLADFPSYDQWNSAIRQAAGPLAVGHALRLRLDVGGGARPFRPTVVAVHPGRELILAATLVHPRLLHARHLFRLEPHDGGTRFTQAWELTGACAALAWPKFRAGLAAFEEMNRDLAHEVGRRNGHA
jgi:hypothetical protein